MSQTAQSLDFVSTRGRPRGPGADPLAGRLGDILVGQGRVGLNTLHLALAHQATSPAPLGRILIQRGDIDDRALADALARQYRTLRLDPKTFRPDLGLINVVGAQFCLVHGVLPLARAGALCVVATATPEKFFMVRAALEERIGPVGMVIAAEPDLRAHLLALRQRHLARLTEYRTPEARSCRGLSSRLLVAGFVAALAALIAAALLAPLALVSALTVCALVVLAVNTALGALIGWQHLRAEPETPLAAKDPPRPVAVSLLVPLFRERRIAERLVARLSQLDYPPEHLEILLITEEDDHVTRAALDAVALPAHMRTLTVPRGQVQTKPRAMNYALDFCHGSIVGVYDAEDAPDTDQIRRVVRQFQHAAPQVACLQGRLDFYNPRTNWIARCFTLEYAAWFRVMLPGLARLGLVLPLGGTTLFFRKAALVAMGGWDAHNVTEDADLGVRLARMGYRTDLLDSTTLEEANCSAWPWVRQRSRWLKGYGMTWLVHMRDPAALWRDLGPRRFWGVQAVFLGSLLGAMLAPFLWALWLLALGGMHPWSGLPRPVAFGLTGALVGATLVQWAVGAMGARARGTPWLMVWMPVQAGYHMLSSIAVLKALLEIAWRPFFWDKTMHGHLSTPGAAPAEPEPEIVAANTPEAPVQVSPVQVGPVQVGPVQVSPVQVGPVQVSLVGGPAQPRP